MADEISSLTLALIGLIFILLMIGLVIVYFNATVIGSTGPVGTSGSQGPTGEQGPPVINTEAGGCFNLFYDNGSLILLIPQVPITLTRIGDYVTLFMSGPTFTTTLPGSKANRITFTFDQLPDNYQPDLRTQPYSTTINTFSEGGNSKVGKANFTYGGIDIYRDVLDDTTPWYTNNPSYGFFGFSISWTAAPIVF